MSSNHSPDSGHARVKRIGDTRLSGDEIQVLVEQIAALPAPDDARTRGVLLDGLDELAEQMVGRHAAADETLKGRIGTVTAGLRGQPG